MVRRGVPAHLFGVILLGLFGVSACGYSRYIRKPYLPDPPPAARAVIKARVLLIGDAGRRWKPDEAALHQDFLNLLARLRRHATDGPPSLVVWLGDNIYDRGLPPIGSPPNCPPCDQLQGTTGATRDRCEAECVLTQQLDVLKDTSAQAVFVPGNHDWDRWGPRGWEAVRQQGRFIQTRGGDDRRVRLLPGGGCPGPIWVDLADTVRVIAIDTEWLLRKERYPKPIGFQSGCGYGSETAPQAYPELSAETFYDRLRWALRQSRGRQVLVVAHHPIRTHGPHGGPTTLAHHFHKKFPLPLAGLIRYGFLRHDQDLDGPRNQEMRERLEMAFITSGHPPLAYVAGHDHGLQVLRDESLDMYHLVSGAGSKLSSTGKGSDTLFKDVALGYLKLDFLDSGRVQLGVIEAGDGSVYSTTIR